MDFLKNLRGRFAHDEDDSAASTPKSSSGDVPTNTNGDGDASNDDKSNDDRSNEGSLKELCAHSGSKDDNAHNNAKASAKTSAPKIAAAQDANCVAAHSSVSQVFVANGSSGERLRDEKESEDRNDSAATNGKASASTNFAKKASVAAAGLSEKTMSMVQSKVSECMARLCRFACPCCSVFVWRKFR